jgi:ketosteroid isomerase-like protein
MSQENVALVRASFEAYVTGDRDAYLDFMADDVEIRPDVSRLPEATPYRGREEARRWLTDVDQAWEGGASASELREIFPVGDRVVVRADWGGTGRASGVDLLSNLTSIYNIRGGQISRIEFLFDHAEALAAVGLSE